MTGALSRRMLLGTALAYTSACAETPAPIATPQPPPPAGGNLVALLIGDTLDHSAPLGGAGIGPGVTQNIAMMRNLLASVSTATGMPLRSSEILGSATSTDNFTCPSINTALNAVQAGPADTVFIYYAGHGFNLGPTTEQLRRQSIVPPPVLSLPTAGAQHNMPYLYCGSFGDNPNVFGIARRMAGMGSRLVIVISDSCNSYIPGTGPQPAPAAAPSLGPDQRLISLFLNSRGTVMMAAAKPGNYAFYHPTGGLFTRNLLQALDGLPAAAQPSWADLAAATTTRLKREQVVFEGQTGWPLDPVFEMTS